MNTSSESHGPDLISAIYARRFAGTERRRQEVWEVICKVGLQPWISKSARVLDLGGGYGEFINHIEASYKYVVDINPTTKQKVNDNVEVLVGTLPTFETQLKGKVEVIFSSNFLEHLPNKDVLIETIRTCHRILSPKGRLILMGPNIRYLAGEYWDFLDHHLALSDRSIDELLGVTGFRVLEKKAKFLPYTFNQSLPSHPALVSLYLRTPLAQRIFGKQFFFVAEKS